MSPNSLSHIADPCCKKAKIIAMISQTVALLGYGPIYEAKLAISDGHDRTYLDRFLEAVSVQSEPGDRSVGLCKCFPRVAEGFFVTNNSPQTTTRRDARELRREGERRSSWKGPSGSRLSSASVSLVSSASRVCVESLSFVSNPEWSADSIAHGTFQSDDSSDPTRQPSFHHRSQCENRSKGMCMVSSSIFSLFSQHLDVDPSTARSSCGIRCRGSCMQH